MVSVPCRGTTFLNQLTSAERLTKKCFRPLSGNYISQLTVQVTMDNLAKSFRPLSGNYISQFVSKFVSIATTMFPSPVGELHFSIPSLQSRHQSGLMVGIAWEKYFWKINKIHSLKSAANSVFKPCAAKSKQIFSFIKKYQFHIVPSYILFPDSGYISKYVVKPSFLYLYNVYDLVAHLFCQRYLLLFQYLLFHQT